MCYYFGQSGIELDKARYYEQNFRKNDSRCCDTPYHAGSEDPLLIPANVIFQKFLHIKGTIGIPSGIQILKSIIDYKICFKLIIAVSASLYMSQKVNAVLIIQASFDIGIDKRFSRFAFHVLTPIILL